GRRFLHLSGIGSSESDRRDQLEFHCGGRSRKGAIPFSRSSPGGALPHPLFPSRGLYWERHAGLPRLDTWRHKLNNITKEEAAAPIWRCEDITSDSAALTRFVEELTRGYVQVESEWAEPNSHCNECPA